MALLFIPAPNSSLINKKKLIFYSGTLCSQCHGIRDTSLKMTITVYLERSHANFLTHPSCLTIHNHPYSGFNRLSVGLH
jgi:hypothetical protein